MADFQGQVNGLLHLPLPNFSPGKVKCFEIGAHLIYFKIIYHKAVFHVTCQGDIFQPQLEEYAAPAGGWLASN